MKIPVDWQYVTDYGTWESMVPARDYRGDGHYHIFMQARPGYCDRGRWVVNVNGDGVAPLDDQEGFPRYYFDLEVAKKEMEAWVNMRETCKAAKKGEHDESH